MYSLLSYAFSFPNLSFPFHKFGKSVHILIDFQMHSSETMQRYSKIKLILPVKNVRLLFPNDPYDNIHEDVEPV